MSFILYTRATFFLQENIKENEGELMGHFNDNFNLLSMEKLNKQKKNENLLFCPTSLKFS